MTLTNIKNPADNTAQLSRRRLMQIGACSTIGLAACTPEPSGKQKPIVPSEHRIDKRLAELGVELPVAGKAVATYVPYRVVGNMVYIAGQGPALSADTPVLGKVGKELTIEQGQHAARLACYNILAQAKAACGGDLDRIVQWVKMGGFVNCVDGFTDQPKVINGATNLLRDVFGEAGLPARFAVGVNALPFNICVEIDASFEMRV